jgi:hypothetical protein
VVSHYFDRFLIPSPPRLFQPIQHLSKTRHHIAAPSKQLISHFKAKISEQVEITDLGELHWLLGIEVRRNIPFIFPSDPTILRHFNLDDLKPTSTPMQPGLLLYGSQTPKTTAEWAQMRDTPYREAIGSLMYAALGTHPDNVFAIQTLSRYSPKFGPAHWNTVKWVFSYLKGTKELWLTYGQTQGEMMGYADADGSTAEDRLTISGYAFIINGRAVSWSAKPQLIISLSTTESEYVAAAHAAKEALWLQSLIKQLFDENCNPLPCFPTISPPSRLPKIINIMLNPNI